MHSYSSLTWFWSILCYTFQHAFSNSDLFFAFVEILASAFLIRFSIFIAFIQDLCDNRSSKSSSTAERKSSKCEFSSIKKSQSFEQQSQWQGKTRCTVFTKYLSIVWSHMFYWRSVYALQVSWRHIYIYRNCNFFFVVTCNYVIVVYYLIFCIYTVYIL